MGLPIVARGYSWQPGDRSSPTIGPIDLDIRAGESVLLLGPSGAGKSTLLQAITGVLPAESGTASGEIRLGELAPDPRRGVCGFLSQDPDAQVIFSRVGDDVAFGMENLGVPVDEIEDRITSALAAAGLPLDHAHPTSALSGGQKQRLALAGILAMEPQVIVLDEPTANIDPGSVPAVRDAVLRTREATSATMILVEHRVDQWVEHVDTVIVLGPEGVLVQGHPEEVFTDPAARSAIAEAGVWEPRSVPSRAAPGSAVGRDGALLGSETPTVFADSVISGSDSSVPDADPPILCAEGLSVARPGADSPAATDIDLQVAPGEAIGIIGPNGAGKSTTALTMAGLIPETTGAVTAHGRLREDAKHSRPFRWPSKFLASRIGMVFQEPEHQFLRASVSAELSLGPELAGWTSAEVDARVIELLSVLGLTHLAGAHPQSLSGGEKRRLSVAAMIAPRPQVLVVDEPTFGQDARTWAGLVTLFRDVLNHGCAVVAVSHDEAFLQAIEARIVDFG